jgi:C_GCAxxG_C_C family probable redox protein
MQRWKDDLEQQWQLKREAEYETPSSMLATREKILDAIAQSAFSNLSAYGNCCRSTLWAIQTHLRREEAGTLRASAVLAGGICGLGETCGAVLGGMLAIGEATASEEFRDLATYQAANAAARRFIEDIRERYGSTRCYEIQDRLMGWRCDDPSKARRWIDQGGLTACAGLCAGAASLAAGIILDQLDE